MEEPRKDKRVVIDFCFIHGSHQAKFSFDSCVIGGDSVVVGPEGSQCSSVHAEDLALIVAVIKAAEEAGFSTFYPEA